MDKKELYAYTAGLIDGEGYISLLPVQKSKGYCAVVKVTSTDKFMAKFLHENFGGHIAKPRNHPYPMKPSINWTLRNRNNVNTFLRKIYPYLLVKKAQADVVIEYTDTFSPNSLRNEDIWKQKDEFYRRIRALNKRGIAPAETK